MPVSMYLHKQKIEFVYNVQYQSTPQDGSTSCHRCISVSDVLIPALQSDLCVCAAVWKESHTTDHAAPHLPHALTCKDDYFWYNSRSRLCYPDFIPQRSVTDYNLPFVNEKVTNSCRFNAVEQALPANPPNKIFSQSLGWDQNIGGGATARYSFSITAGQVKLKFVMH